LGFTIPQEQLISHPPQTAPDKTEEEPRRLRRLQIIVAMVASVLSQDPDLTLEQAAAMIGDCRNAALAMFPGKELAFDLMYKPRLERVVKERFRL
jgi:hypothetical protein